MVLLSSFLLATCLAFVFRGSARVRAELRVLRAFGIPRAGILLCVAGPSAMATLAGVALVGAALQSSVGLRVGARLGWFSAVSVPREALAALLLGAAWGALVTLGRSAHALRSLR
jgi:hypothetical protein